MVPTLGSENVTFWYPKQLNFRIDVMVPTLGSENVTFRYPFFPFSFCFSVILSGKRASFKQTNLFQIFNFQDKQINWMPC